MATANGKRTAAGAGAKTASRTPAKKSAGTAKQTAGAKPRSIQKESPLKKAMPVMGIGLLMLGVFLLFSLFSASSAVAVLAARAFVNGTFGSMGVIVCLGLLYGGAQLVLRDRWPLPRILWLQIALIMVCLLTLLQVFRVEELLRALHLEGFVQNYNGFLWKSYMASVSVPLGGGSLGGLLAYPLVRYLDVIGSAMLLLVLMGGLVVWLISTVAPSAGEQLSQQFSAWRDAYLERRDERQSEREAAYAEQEAANSGLLVSLPEDLLVSDDTLPQPRVTAKGRRKPKSKDSDVGQVVTPDVPAWQQEEQRQQALAKERTQNTKPVAKREKPQPRSTAPAPRERAPARPALPRNARPRLYIENEIHVGSSAGAPQQPTYSPRTARRDDSAIPESVVKKRAEYDAQFGPIGASERIAQVPVRGVTVSETPPRKPEAPLAPPRMGGVDSEEDVRGAIEPESFEILPFPGGREADAADGPETYEDAFADESDYPVSTEDSRGDSVWRDDSGFAPREEERIEDAGHAQDAEDAEAYEPPLAEQEIAGSKAAGASRIIDVESAIRTHAAKRGGEYRQPQNPLDRQPQLDPKTRLDRPDWRPPEEEEKKLEHEVIPDDYRSPPFSLLVRDDGRRVDTREADAIGAAKLEETLLSFGVTANVIKVVHGPAITRYELQPAPGVKVSKIVNLTDDIALNMAAVGVRIEAPIPGKAAIGIELANDEVQTVHLRDVLESEESRRNPSRLAVALGKDIAGKRIIADLARMPHLLIAGATGAGKSVCINTLITSIIYRSTPEEVRLILIDPKKVELAVYNGIPHLLVPVVTDPKKASGALNWAVMEMDERYKLFAEIGVRDIKGYNSHRAEDVPLMPQIVVIIDELSDLMLVAPGEVEEAICRLAQLARACGIHLVIATQRPSVNVITGIIKANIPSRIAFAVSSQVDSRTILDGAGAEKLLGKGDMLFAPSGGGKPMRVQGCFVSDDEVARVVEYVKDRHTTDYSQAVIEALESPAEAENAPADEVEENTDALFDEAVDMVIESGQASISMLQRRMRIGYARAGRLVDEMSRRGIISQPDGAKPREVLMTREEYKTMFGK